MRRCAWAWVCPKPGSNRDGARGALGGEQTVPRAELTAIRTCLQDLSDHHRIKEIEIFSDCKMAVDGFARGRSYSQLTACGAIWAELCILIEELSAKGITIRIRKVKAHSDDDVLAPLPLRLGNQCADYYASISVVEVPASETASINWRDRKLRAIQERMITALQMLP